MKKEEGATRRDFLKLAGTAAPAVAVAVASGGASAAPMQPDLTSTKMQDTEHTRAYLKAARF